MDYLKDEIELLSLKTVVEYEFLALAIYDDLKSELIENLSKEHHPIIIEALKSCYESVVRDLMSQDKPSTTQDFITRLIAKVKGSEIASIIDNINGICNMYMDTNNFLESREYLIILNNETAELSYKLLIAKNARDLILNNGRFYDSNFRPYSSDILRAALIEVLKGEFEPKDNLNKPSSK